MMSARIQETHIFPWYDVPTVSIRLHFKDADVFYSNLQLTCICVQGGFCFEL